MLILCLTGCGGGGGGSSKGSLTVNTDWTNHSTGTIGGQSEKISLLTVAGNLVTSAQMNQDAPGLQSITIGSLAKRQYHLLIELFTGRNLTGSRVGVIDALITISGNQSFANAVGNDVTSVKVTPASASVVASSTQQFYAAGYAANNQATFVAPGTITWQVLGGLGSISSEGLFSALNPGNGSVVATHTASSTQGAATVTVTPFVATQSKWTVIVFMNAANDLVTFSPLNMNQMEKVAGNPEVRFVVQWKEAVTVPDSTFNSTRRYLMQQDDTNQIVSPILEDLGPGVDMGDKNTLHDFIAWAKTHYPAQHYCLVVWNHGNGWRRSAANDMGTRGVSYDDETGNSIKTWELTQALGSNHFDILAWDASLMQMVEVAYEIKGNADYIVGSEESPPAAGYPYDLVFAPFKNNPDTPVATLTKSFVDGMLTEYGATSFKITQSVIDTTKLDALATSVDTLGSSLIANVGSLTTLVPSVRSSAQSFSPGVRTYRDLWDVCDKLQAGSPPAGVATACAGVKTAVQNAVIWEGHNGNSPGSHGISIDFSSSTSFTSLAADYSLLRLAADTSWNEWLTVAP